jgi:hypothetical protein
MVVDGGRCRDLAGHAGRYRISPVIYVWPALRFEALPCNRRVAGLETRVQSQGNAKRPCVDWIHRSAGDGRTPACKLLKLRLHSSWQTLPNSGPLPDNEATHPNVTY